MIIVWNCDLFQASRRATGREDFSIKVPESPLKKWSIPKQEHLGKPSRSGWEVELITRNRVGVMWSKKSNPDSFKKALVFLVADNWTCFLGIVRNWRCHYSKTLPSDLALWKSFPSFYFCQPRACISQQWPLWFQWGCLSSGVSTVCRSLILTLRKSCIPFTVSSDQPVPSSCRSVSCFLNR